MHFVHDNQQWWVLEILDGFGPHVSSLEAMKVREDHKILVLKEEGDSSHVNQAYDKCVALHDKSKRRKCLSTLRGAKYITKGVVDQYDLVHTGLICVATTKAET